MFCVLLGLSVFLMNVDTKYMKYSTAFREAAIISFYRQAVFADWKSLVMELKRDYHALVRPSTQ